MNPKKILITGVTGSLGGSLAAYFVKAGYETYGSVRHSASQTKLTSIEKSKQIVIDLSKEEEYCLPEGLDAVIHCAAATSERTAESDLSRQVNVEGTRRILAACKRAKVKRFIFISTMSANPENPSDYAQTKLEAERLVQKSEGIEHVIVRPGLIISPSTRGIFHKLQRYVAKLPVIPVIGDNPNLATISINDLCKTVELSIDSENAPSTRINACADESLSILQIVHLIARASGRNTHCMMIPYSIALTIAAVSASLKLPILTKDNVYGLQYAKAGDTSSLKRILGFEAEKGETSIVKLFRNEGESLL